MPISQVGSTLEFNGGNENTGSVTTITVPSGTELVMVGFSSYAGSGTFFTTGASVTFTKGGSQVAMTCATPISLDLGAFAGSVFYLVNPDIGTNKTLAWDWEGTSQPDRTAAVSVTFWSGINQSAPVRQANSLAWVGFGVFTRNLTTVAGDAVVSYIGAFADPNGSVTTWTRLVTVTNAAVVEFSDAAWGVNTAPSAGTTSYGFDVPSGWGDGYLHVFALAPAGGSLVTNPYNSYLPILVR